MLRPGQQELIFPVLKSKYQSVNSGNLSDIVTGSSGSNSFVIRNENAGAALSQLLQDTTTTSNYATTKRALSNNHNVKRGSSQQKVAIVVVQQPSSQQSVKNAEARRGSQKTALM